MIFRTLININYYFNKSKFKTNINKIDDNYGLTIIDSNNNEIIYAGVIKFTNNLQIKKMIYYGKLTALLYLQKKKLNMYNMPVNNANFKQLSILLNNGLLRNNDEIMREVYKNNNLDLSFIKKYVDKNTEILKEFNETTAKFII